MKRSGRNVSGSSYTAGSCMQALHPDAATSLSSVLQGCQTYTPNVGQYDGPLWDEVPVQLVVGDGCVGDTERDDAMPSQGLFNERIYVDQRFRVAEVGHATGPDDGVQFGLGLLLHVGVLRYGEEERLKGGKRL